jgi:uncharacterized membrane protein YbhN (UPF0104 family)
LPVLQRVRSNQWARISLLAVILGFCCYGLANEWPRVRPMLGELHWYSVTASAVAAAAAAGCLMLAWRTLLADLGSPLPVLVAARVTFVAQLGKYLPGAIWSFAAHVELVHEYQVPRRRGAASLLMALAVAAGVGLLISAVTLPFAAPAAAHHYRFLLLAVPLIAVCLVPSVMHKLLNLALRVVRQEPLERPVSWRGLGIALAWTVLGWLLLGLQICFLLADVTHGGPRTWLLGLGAYTLAWTLALLVVVAPNGIGAREVVLVAALAPVLPASAALAVALVARLVTTLSDLAWSTVGLALKRHARSSESAALTSLAQPEAATALAHQVGKHRKTPSSLVQ